VVSTTGNVSLDIAISIAQNIIAADIRCVPAVETAGYVFFTYIFSNIARGLNHGKRI